MCSQAWCNGKEISLFWVNVELFAPLALILFIAILILLLFMKR